MILAAYVFFGIILYYVFKGKEEEGLYMKEICINCGEEVDKSSLHCPNCNEQLKKECSNCGKIIDISWRSCPFCDSNQLSNQKE
ncbi:zinc ribbon domain-containing protein [Sporosalibacterium faouarense]|uniref:zinc ribbon domain-containing protein n=1 Tax=Sporosalibacterium faouarense TaxID=516123 RepID=UPI00141C3593|nr:zinc ribbon domain-containing protein [Sporosalibacterium faouarense]MTI48543.1 zinc ribbon domain-containing protein [Bacillota bacterium]